MPCPDPIGEPKGITVAQPAFSNCVAKIGSAFIYGSIVNCFATKYSAANNVASPSGNKYFGSGITSSFIKLLS